MSSTLLATDDPFVKGGWLYSKSSNYLVQSFLGQGTFGKVVKCMRMDDMKTVAIKLMKNKGFYAMQAKQEVFALLKLKQMDSDKSNLVRWFQAFTDRGHICLEFEHLDKSLLDFMNERSFRPLLLKEIRPIVQQLANALDHLKAVGIIHADLKLENVMLVNHVQEPYRVKMIDFGLACDVSGTKVGSYIQTRTYRSPEIILGLPFTEAIDMWSLGCVAATLYLGTLLYPGRSEYDMMSYIVETQGQPPDHLLTVAHKTCSFFQRDYSSTTSLWKLKTPEQFHQEMGIQPMETRRLKLSSLDDLLHICSVSTDNAADKVAEMIDVLMFVDMLKGMLQLDANERLTPRQVLKHYFTDMRHIVSMYDLSSHARSCFDIMNVCQETLTSDSGKAVCGSLQQPSPRTVRPIQQTLSPSPPAERSHLSKSHCINPHPCTGPETSSPVKLGIKMKDSDADGNMDETFHLSKRTKPRCCSESCASLSTSSQSRSHQAQHPSNSNQNQSYASPRAKSKMAPGEACDSEYERSDRGRKRVRQCYAGRSTCSSSHDSSRILHVRAHRRRSPAEHHHSHSTHPPSSTQTESWAWSGLKRRRADEDNGWHKQSTSDLRSDNDREGYLVCLEEERRRRGPHSNERRRTEQRHQQGSRDHESDSRATVAWSCS